jgi:hypothetical protein
VTVGGQRQQTHQREDHAEGVGAGGGEAEVDAVVAGGEVELDEAVG